MCDKSLFTILVIVGALNFCQSNSNTSVVNNSISSGIEDDDNSFIAMPHFGGILKLSIRNNTLLPGIKYSESSVQVSSLTFDWTRQTFFHLIGFHTIRIIPFNATDHPIESHELAIVKIPKSEPVAIYFEDVERYLYVFYNSDKSVTRFDPYIGDEGRDLILKLGESDIIYTLVVDPCESMMYWTNYGRSIQRASTIGLNQKIETIMEIRGLTPQGLAIDPLKKELYWSGSAGLFGRIERSDLRGRNRMIIVNKPMDKDGPSGTIAVTKEFIYYPADPAYSANIYRVNKAERNGIVTHVKLNSGMEQVFNSIVYANRPIESRHQCVWRPNLHNWNMNSQAVKEKSTFGLGQQNRRLSCVYTNAANTRVKWLHNDKNVDLNVVKIRNVNSDLGGKSESLITLKEIRLSDEGNYTCQVSNRDFEESVNFMIEICLSCVPKIDKSESEKVLAEGTGDQFLTCKYNTTSRPNVTWTHNGQAMPELISARWRWNDWNGTIGESVIRFTKTNLDDGGIYACSVVNEFGEDYYEINVQVAEKEAGRNEIIFALTGTGIVIIILILVMGYLWRKYIAQKRIILRLTDGEVKEFFEGRLEAQVSNPNDCGNITALTMPFDPKNEMSMDDLIIGSDAPLGEGQFGLVLQGSYQDRAVAVKTVKPNSDVAYLKALLSEIKIMAFIGNHKGIVEFLGAHTSKIQENIVYMVVELSPIGDLHSYLQQNRPTYYLDKVTEDVYENLKCPMSQKHFMNWSLQIAEGMKYLKEKKVVHADLATRNVLMFHDDVLKISDFGLSRQLYGYTKYVKKSKSPLPFRWMALESLRFMEFTSQSDVWSYGVTIWEIYTLGQVPYPEFNWSAKFVQLLVQGLRLSKPDHATVEIYREMLKCWDPDPQRRATFEQLVNFFQTLLHQPHHPNLKDARTSEGRYIHSGEVSIPDVHLRHGDDEPSVPLAKCLFIAGKHEQPGDTDANTSIYLSI